LQSIAIEKILKRLKKEIIKKEIERS